MTAHDHRTLFLEITPERREAIKRLIEDLIDLTDLIDGDADLEDGEDADIEDDPAEAGIADDGGLATFYMGE